jgi:hypothetical protein
MYAIIAEQIKLAKVPFKRPFHDFRKTDLPEIIFPHHEHRFIYF